MPFGMGFGELVLIAIVIVVVFGSTRLSGLGDGLGHLLRGEEPPPSRLLLERRRGWTWPDWAIVILTASMASAALVMLLRSGHR